VTAPLVSVIIGAYNAERYIAEAIDSVLAQTHRPLELIVVDDGSTDATADIAREYGDAVVLLQQERQGNGGARNTGVARAAGAYLGFLDADDRFTESKVERQLALLAAEPELDMVFGHVVEFVSPELDEDARTLIRPAAPEAPWTAPNLMLIRRASFDRVGPFSTTLRVGVTVDWYARAVDAGLRYAILPEVVLERRLHTDNNGRREAAARSQYVRVLKESLERRRAEGRA
jgi:glycosyltransferase involved in cell wall biosynthesis